MGGLEPIEHTYSNGAKEWRLNGVWHRKDGPAIERGNGTETWYLYGKRHREDGPAFTHVSGTKQWCLNGLLHRIDGPACEYHDGTVAFYLEHKELSPIEFMDRITDQDVIDKVLTDWIFRWQS